MQLHEQAEIQKHEKSQSDLQDLITRKSARVSRIRDLLQQLGIELPPQPGPSQPSPTSPVPTRMLNFPVLLPSQLGQVDTLLDSGFSSRVFSGSLLSNPENVPVAIKIFQPSYIQDHEELLLKEAEVWYSLQQPVQHPNIVRLYGMVLGDTFQLVMELCETTLRRRLDTPPEVEPSLKLSYTFQIADALSYLHQKSYAHRDLKAANVLLTNGGQTVKLADFGFAKGSRDDRGHSVLSLTKMGSPGYMAPEMDTIGGYKLQPADMYALAMTFHEIVYPEYRFPPPGRSYPADCVTPEQKAAYRMEIAAPPENYRPPVEPPRDAFEAVILPLIQRCWDPSPILRHSAAVVLATLRAAQL
jgi:serine/threonine protein kinase